MSSIRRSLFMSMVLFSGVVTCAQAIPRYVACSLHDMPNAMVDGINNAGQAFGTMHEGRDYFVASNGVLNIFRRQVGIVTSIDVNDAGVMLYEKKLRYADGSTVDVPEDSYAINNHGQVAASLGRVGAGGPNNYAALISPGGGTLLAGIDRAWNHPMDINDHGVMVGYSIRRGTFPTMYANGQSRLLETYGDGEGYARAINNHGFAVGESGGYAALWNPDGSLLVNLGEMLKARFGSDDPDFYSTAYGINNVGEVVGEYGRFNGFLYSGGELYDLGEIASGFTGAVVDINDQHQIAVRGWGSSYVLNLAGPLVQPVPEPSTYMLLLVGLLALALLRRKKA